MIPRCPTINFNSVQYSTIFCKIRSSPFLRYIETNFFRLFFWDASVRWCIQSDNTRVWGSWRRSLTAQYTTCRSITRQLLSDTSDSIEDSGVFNTDNVIVLSSKETAALLRPQSQCQKQRVPSEQKKRYVTKFSSRTRIVIITLLWFFYYIGDIPVVLIYTGTVYGLHSIFICTGNLC